MLTTMLDGAILPLCFIIQPRQQTQDLTQQQQQKKDKY